MGETFNALPRFAYRRGDFDLEGKFAYSDSTSWYDPQGRRNSIRDTNTPTASGVSYRAQRADSMAENWTFTQIAGPDIPTAPASQSGCHGERRPLRANCLLQRRIETRR